MLVILLTILFHTIGCSAAENAFDAIQQNNELYNTFLSSVNNNLKTIFCEQMGCDPRYLWMNSAGASMPFDWDTIPVSVEPEPEPEDDPGETEQLTCQSAEALDLLNKDFWSPGDTEFYETYKGLVQSVFDPYADDGVIEAIDRYTEEYLNVVYRRMDLIEDLRNTICPEAQFETQDQCLEFIIATNELVQVYDEALSRLAETLSANLENPVTRPLQKISEFEEQNESCSATEDGQLKNTRAPTWFLSKSSHDVFLEIGRSVGGGFSHHWVSTIVTDDNQEIQFEFFLSVGAVSEVKVSPGSWYDPYFWETLRNLQFNDAGLREPYTLCPMDPDKVNILGEGGVLQSIITRLFVVNEISLSYEAASDGFRGQVDMSFGADDNLRPQIVGIYAPKLYDQFC